MYISHVNHVIIQEAHSCNFSVRAVVVVLGNLHYVSSLNPRTTHFLP